MLSYKDLFQVLKAGGTVGAEPGSETQRKIDVLWRMGIVETTIRLDGDKWISALHPKQRARLLQAPEIAPNPTKIEAPRMVHVDWQGRGFSSGKYEVSGEDGEYLKIVFETDKRQIMTVKKSKTEAA